MIINKMQINERILPVLHNSYSTNNQKSNQLNSYYILLRATHTHTQKKELYIANQK